MDNGQPLEANACKRLFDLEGENRTAALVGTTTYELAAEIDKEQQRVLSDLQTRNGKWLDSEIEKLDRWTEDLKFGLEQEIKDMGQGDSRSPPGIRCRRRVAAQVGNISAASKTLPLPAISAAKTSSSPRMRLRHDAKP